MNSPSSRPFVASRFTLSWTQLAAAFVTFSMIAVVLSFTGPLPVAVAQTGNPVVTIAEVPGPSGFGVETGTAIFDGFGNCGGAAPMAPPVPHPGDDCTAGDNIVRSNDIVSYGTSVSVSNMLSPTDPGGPEHVDNTFFVQTITPSGPDAVVEFANLPAACRTGTNADTGAPYDPQSAINPLPGGGSEIICNLGRLTGPTKTVFMRTQVRVLASSKNEASFTSNNEICPDGFSTNGCSVVSERPEVTGIDTNDLSDDEVTYVSARPQFDLSKNKYGPNAYGTVIKRNVIADPDDDEPGLALRYYLQIEADAASDGKGGMELSSDPITFDDILYVLGTTTPIPGYELMDFTSTGVIQPCYWNNHAGRPIPYGLPGGVRTLTNSTPNSGTWTCTQAAPGAPIEMTITGADTSGTSYPDTGSNNSTQLTPPYYVATGWVNIWFPYDTIDRYDAAAVCDAADTAAGFSAPFCGELDGTGNLPLTNCVANFDPDAVDANGDPVSNYGPDIEPGTYGSGAATNNCKNASLQLTNSGSFSKYFTTAVTNSINLGGLPPGQTYYHTGNGPFEPNQYITSWARYNNTGTVPQANVGVCEKIDNMTYSVAPILANAAWVPTNAAGQKMPAFGRTQYDYPNDQTTTVIEYASGPAGTPATGAVPWDNDHLAGGISALSGLYDNSTFAAAQSAGCTDAEGNWTTDPYSFDADPTTSLSKIRAVRVQTIPGYQLAAGDRLVLKVQIKANNTFNGGPNDGTLIPSGVISPNFATWKAGGVGTSDYRPTSYNPNTDWPYDGDRMIFSRGFVRLEKWIVPYNTPHASVDPATYTNVDGGLAGDPFQFRLLPAAISNLNPATAPVTNVTVVDVLPSWLTYDPVCTANVSAYGPPIITPNAPNPGETTLTWNLGTIMPNTQIDPIDFCVDSSQLAPDGTDAVNVATISATEDTSTEAQRSASATVQLAQLGEFRMAKSVDTNLDPENNPQNFTIEWLNSSDFVTLDAPIVIDVFSHNLDGTSEGSGAPRNPESDFSGTIELLGAANAPNATVNGDFYFTKRDEFVVQQDPAHATNPFASAPYDPTNPNLGPLPDANNDGEADSGKTIWCLPADFGANGCPGSYADSTALMLVAEDKVGPGDTGSMTFSMQTFGNDSGDEYGNRAAGFTPSLPGQISQTNTVVVEVVALSVGDFVFFDYDNDGNYDPAQGEVPIPDGVTIQLFDATNTLVGTQTTVNGRYVFNDLVDGDYSLAIPASEFAAGGPLDGYVPSTPVAPANNDANEDVDQQGTLSGGAVVTDPVTLSFSNTPPDPVTGDVIVTGEEPVGEDVGGVDFFSVDALSNLTVDIGLIGEADVALVKTVNTVDANTTPGPYVAPGSTATFAYTVENTGEADLFNVAVTDNIVAASAISCPNHLGDTNNDNVIDILRVGETVTCTASATATAGQYTNTGSVDADTPVGGTVDDTDDANYYGVTTGISIEKTTNGDDADATSGPQIDAGDPVNWEYTVVNTGNVTLVDVTVTDDVVAATSIDCGSGTNVIASLAPGAANAVACTATGTATPGQYENTGSVTGDPVDASGTPLTGAPIPTDDDLSHYYGIDPSVGIEKATNGVDADTTTGPVLAAGAPVTWTYVVTNDGNVPLGGLTVTDSLVADSAISCAASNGDTDGDNVIDLILPGEVVTCKATGTATLGQYMNTGEVKANPVFPIDEDLTYDPADPATWPNSAADYADIAGATNPTDSDDSHYLGWEGKPDLAIEKATNGFDADNPAGPFIIENGGVVWTYEVKNTGSMALADVGVTDNLVPASAISCASHHGDTNLDNVIDLILPGEVVTCTATGTATVVGPNGQYKNTATTSGKPVFPTSPKPDFDPTDGSTYPTEISAYIGIDEKPPLDSDDSHYFSATPNDPAADIEKATNGADADTPAGPYLVPGAAVTWTFVVENTGGYVLAPATVTDNMVAAADISCANHLDDTNGDNVLDVLRPGDSVTCTATGTASVTGLHNNVATIVGSPVVPENCVGCDPADPQTWPGDPDDYVPATDADGAAIAPATEADPSHYFGATSGIDLQKSTNLVDADTTPGPFLAAGTTVTWTYAVENTGNVPLVDVAVTDNVVAPADISCPTTLADADGNNVIDLLLPGIVVTCTASAPATAGQYANVADVSGDPVYPTNPGPDFDPNDPSTYPANPADYTALAGVASPTASDPSHYFGYEQSIMVEKSTNGDDADTPTGPWIVTGDTVTWTYSVLNDGNVTLTAVSVVDNVVAASAISCAASNGDTNGDNIIDVLLPGDSVDCVASAPNSATGQYTNNATVTGNPAFPTNPGPDFDPDDPSTYPTESGDFATILGATPPEDNDPSNYFSATPGIAIEKATNGADADNAPGPWVDQGDIVSWTYVVENTGNTALVNLVVADDQGVTVDCGAGSATIGLLVPAATATCTASAPASTIGQYMNVGSVTAEPAFPTDPAADPSDPSSWSTDPADYDNIIDPATGSAVASIEADDPSHYFGADSSVVVEKATNGDNADTPSGPWVNQGDTVTWTYEITNDGNTALTSVAVTDNVVAAADISCADHRNDTDANNVIDVLVPDDVVICTATAPAGTVGQYVNTANVSGTPSTPTNPGADPLDPSTWSDDPADYDDLTDPTTGDPVPTAGDTDDSHYFGAEPALTMQKATNGADADEATGPFVVQGDTVTWTYVVANSGNTAVTGVTVTDSLVAAADISCADHLGDTDADNVIDLLLPSQIVTCAASAPAATVGQYMNTGSVDGAPVFPTDPAADASDPSTWSTDPADYGAIIDPDTGTAIGDVETGDPSHYFGAEPSIIVEKSTNGDDADTPQGPWVSVGDTVTWTYEITNDGNTAVTALTVTDNVVAAADISCADHLGDTDANNVIDVLLPGDVVVCTASAPATEGQYANIGSADGQPSFPSNPDPDFDPSDPSTYPTDPSDFEAITDPETGEPTPSTTDGDPSHYIGVIAGATIDKSTNGEDADTPTGPFVVQGDLVTWTYEVANTGATALSGVVVSDTQFAASNISCADHLGDTDGDNVIALMVPGDTVTCTATGLAATVGQYTNTGSVTAPPTFPTNPGPDFDPEDPTTWSTDPADYDDIVDPDTDLPVTPSTETDPSHYFGAAPSVAVEKSTLGLDADTPTGPYVPLGDTVTWSYAVTNDGNAALLGVVVADDQLTPADISCPDHLGDTDANNVIDVLLPGDVVVCTASAPADTTGQYANTGSADGQPSFPSNPDPDFDPEDPLTYPTDPTDFEDITDPETGEPTPSTTGDDPSHYFGADPSLAVEKSTNGVDADTPTGPDIPVGSTVTWTYEITNDGNTATTNVFVGDDQLTAADISCAAHLGDTNGDNIIDVMLPGDVVVCTASALAVAGQYANEGNVAGHPAFPTNPSPDFDPQDPSTYPTSPADFSDVIDPDTGEIVPPVSDVDDSHYFGAVSDLQIEKTTNGSEADAVPGPFVILGDTVVWTYEVTNNSNIALSPVTVSDDQLDPGAISCADHHNDTNGDNFIDVLLPGDVVVCTASAPADNVGQYANVGSAAGQPVFPTNPGPDFDPADPQTWPTDPAEYAPTIDPDTGEPLPAIEGADPSHYFGTTSGISVDKLVDGVDQDEAPGAQLDNGGPVSWTYVVTNTGTAPLVGVVVNDDDPAVTPDCGDGSNAIALLLPGEVVTCTASGTVQPGAYVNIGSAGGDPAQPDTSDPSFDPTDPSTWPTDPSTYEPLTDPDTGLPVDSVDDDDPSHHFGNGPAIDLAKQVCVLFDNAACDPTNDDHWGETRVHLPGESETWRMTVTNSGNVPLTGIVIDDPLVPACAVLVPDLAPGETFVNACESDLENAPFENVAWVKGTGPSGREIGATDSAEMTPPPELKIVKKVDETTLAPGGIAVFTVTVTNVGEGVSTDTTVIDSFPTGLVHTNDLTSGMTSSVGSSSSERIWNVGTLQPGDSVEFSYETVVAGNAAGSLVNSAVVSSTEAEPVDTLDDNEDTAEVAVSSPADPPRRPLSFSGSSTLLTVAVALALLLLGTVLLVGAKRRRD